MFSFTRPDGPALNASNLLVVAFVALGSTSCSYALAVLGGIIGQPSFYKSLNLAEQGQPGYDHTAQIIGAFNGVQAAGACIGAMFNSWSANALSRKRTIQIGAIITVVAAALCGGAVNVAMFMVGRFVSGFGIGVLVTCIPVYQSELAPAEFRGLMVCMHGVMFGVGYSLSSWLNFALFFVQNSTFPWRFPMAFQCVPAIIVLVGSPWLPFSPRWLMSKGREKEAEEVLKKLHSRHGTDDTVHHDVALKELREIKEQLERDEETRRNMGRWELFKTPANRKRTFIAGSMMWFNMFTGVSNQTLVSWVPA